MAKYKDTVSLLYPQIQNIRIWRANCVFIKKKKKRSVYVAIQMTNVFSHIFGLDP